MGMRLVYVYVLLHINQFSLGITSNLQDRVEYKRFIQEMEGADFAPVSYLWYLK